jgi:hypothetical protein
MEGSLRQILSILEPSKATDHYHESADFEFVGAVGGNEIWAEKKALESEHGERFKEAISKELAGWFTNQAVEDVSGRYHQVQRFCTPRSSAASSTTSGMR